MCALAATIFCLAWVTCWTFVWMQSCESSAKLITMIPRRSRAMHSCTSAAWWSGLQCRKLQNSPVARLALPCPCLPPSTRRCQSSTVQSVLNGVDGMQTGELGWDRLWSFVGLRHAPAAWIQTTGFRWSIVVWHRRIQLRFLKNWSHQYMLLRWWKQAEHRLNSANVHSLMLDPRRGTHYPSTL